MCQLLEIYIWEFLLWCRGLKNLTAVARAAAEVWVPSPAQHRSGMATALAEVAAAARIQPLARELTFAAGSAI